MTGDSLAWLLFVLGSLVSAGTGVLVSIVFVALQLRRDLQRQLDELWLLGVEASNATRYARDNSGNRVEGYRADELVALNREWRRGMRNLRLCVTPKQFHKLEHAINAVGEFHTLFASSRYDLYCRRYPFVAKYEDGKTETIQNAMEYGSWISQYGLPDQKKEYQEWIDNRSKLVREIDYLLYVNLDAMDKGVDAIEAHSIPTELERSTDFSVLFPIACKWFFNEIGRGVRRWCCGPECADHCESCAPKKETEK